MENMFFSPTFGQVTGFPGIDPNLWGRESFWGQLGRTLLCQFCFLCIKFSVNCQLRSIAWDQRCVIKKKKCLKCGPVPLTGLMVQTLFFVREGTRRELVKSAVANLTRNEGHSQSIHGNTQKRSYVTVEWRNLCSGKSQEKNIL